MLIQGLTPLNWSMYTIQQAQDVTAPETYRPTLAKILTVVLPIFELSEIFYQISYHLIDCSVEVKNTMLSVPFTSAKERIENSKKTFSIPECIGLACLASTVYSTLTVYLLGICTKHLVITIFKTTFYALNILAAPCLGLINSRLCHLFHQKLTLILKSPEDFKDLEKLVDSISVEGLKKIIPPKLGESLIRKALKGSRIQRIDTFKHIIETPKLRSYIKTFFPHLFKAIFQIHPIHEFMGKPLSFLSFIFEQECIIKETKKRMFEEFIIEHPEILLYEAVADLAIEQNDKEITKKEPCTFKISIWQEKPRWTFLKYMMIYKAIDVCLKLYPITITKRQVIYKGQNNDLTTVKHERKLKKFIEALKQDQTFLKSKEAVEVSILLNEENLLQTILDTNKRNFLASISLLANKYPLIEEEILYIKNKFLLYPSMFLSKQLKLKSHLPFNDTSILTN